MFWTLMFRDLNGCIPQKSENIFIGIFSVHRIHLKTETIFYGFKETVHFILILKNETIKIPLRDILSVLILLLI